MKLKRFSSKSWQNNQKDRRSTTATRLQDSSYPQKSDLFSWEVKRISLLTNLCLLFRNEYHWIPKSWFMGFQRNWLHLLGVCIWILMMVWVSPVLPCHTEFIITTPKDQHVLKESLVASCGYQNTESTWALLLHGLCFFPFGFYV